MEVSRQACCVQVTTFRSNNILKNPTEKQIMEKVTSCVDMEISSEDQQQFDNATHCYLCKKEIKPNDKKGCKVRDHCHLTGAYRGCAHKHCNLTYNYKGF